MGCGSCNLYCSGPGAVIKYVWDGTKEKKAHGIIAAHHYGDLPSVLCYWINETNE